MGRWRKVAAVGATLVVTQITLSYKDQKLNFKPYQALAQPMSYIDQPNKQFLTLQPKRVGIIGAGLSGCMAAKTFLQQGFKVEVMEKRNSWDVAAGRKARMQVNCPLPDFPMDAGNSEQHRSERTQANFLSEYIDTFSLSGSIMLNCAGQGISQNPDGSWNVFTTAGRRTYDFLIIASGFTPQPLLANSDKSLGFKGRVLTSEVILQSPSLITDKHVVVVGCGEDALDVLNLVSASATQVTHIVRKCDTGMNVTHSWLTDWCLCTRLAQFMSVPWYNEKGNLGKDLVRWVLDVLFTHLHNVTVPKEFHLQSFARSIPTLEKRKSWNYDQLRKKVNVVEGGEITSASDATLTVNSSDIKCDILIYTSIDNPAAQMFTPLEDCWLYRNTISPGYKNLAFIGLFNSTSAPLYTSLQVQWLLDVVRGRVILPSEEAMKEDCALRKSHSAALDSSFSDPYNWETYSLTDQYLTDMYLSRYRKSSWFSELFCSQHPSDYRSVLTHSY